VLIALAIASCRSSSGNDSSANSQRDVNPSGGDGAPACVVDLHGKGGDGADTTVVDGVARVAPRGNDEAWGGWQWDYLTPQGYTRAISIVSDAIDGAGCEHVAVHGYSNGAAFAAKMYCRGETFDDRLIGLVIDDPVTDKAVDGCAPAPTVEATVYWTGGLERSASNGTDCSSLDWTCEGGVFLGIDAFSAAIGIEPTPSPWTEHRRFDDAPDPTVWLTEASMQDPS
jgi:hypothetical protein